MPLKQCFCFGSLRRCLFDDFTTPVHDLQRIAFYLTLFAAFVAEPEHPEDHRWEQRPWVDFGAHEAQLLEHLQHHPELHPTDVGRVGSVSGSLTAVDGSAVGQIGGVGVREANVSASNGGNGSGGGSGSNVFVIDVFVAMVSLGLRLLPSAESLDAATAAAPVAFFCAAVGFGGSLVRLIAALLLLYVRFGLFGLRSLHGIQSHKELLPMWAAFLLVPSCAAGVFSVDFHLRRLITAKWIRHGDGSVGRAGSGGAAGSDVDGSGGSGVGFRAIGGSNRHDYVGVHQACGSSGASGAPAGSPGTVDVATSFSRKVLLITATTPLFFGGVHKLINGGWQWLDGRTLALYVDGEAINGISFHGTWDWVYHVIRALPLWAMSLLSVATLALELGIALTICCRPLRLPLFAAAAALHYLIRWSMGPDFTINIAVYMLALDGRCLKDVISLRAFFRADRVGGLRPNSRTTGEGIGACDTYSDGVRDALTGGADAGDSIADDDDEASNDYEQPPSKTTPTLRERLVVSVGSLWLVLLLVGGTLQAEIPLLFSSFPLFGAYLPAELRESARLCSLPQLRERARQCLRWPPLTPACGSFAFQPFHVDFWAPEQSTTVALTATASTTVCGSGGSGGTQRDGGGSVGAGSGGSGGVAVGGEVRCTQLEATLTLVPHYLSSRPTSGACPFGVTRAMLVPSSRSPNRYDLTATVGPAAAACVRRAMDSAATPLPHHVLPLLLPPFQAALRRATAQTVSALDPAVAKMAMPTLPLTELASTPASAVAAAVLRDANALLHGSGAGADPLVGAWHRWVLGVTRSCNLTVRGARGQVHPDAVDVRLTFCRSDPRSAPSAPHDTHRWKVAAAAATRRDGYSLLIGSARNARSGASHPAQPRSPAAPH